MCAEHKLYLLIVIQQHTTAVLHFKEIHIWAQTLFAQCNPRAHNGSSTLSNRQYVVQHFKKCTFQHKLDLLIAIHWCMSQQLQIWDSILRNTHSQTELDLHRNCCQQPTTSLSVHCNPLSPDCSTSQECKSGLTSQSWTLFLIRAGQGQGGQGVQGGYGWSGWSMVRNPKVAVSHDHHQGQV